MHRPLCKGGCCRGTLEDVVHGLIGIDNFIMGKPTRVTKIRKRHSAAVLRKQKEVRLQAQTLLQEDTALILGRFAEQNSQKSTQNALGRAAMAT